MIEQTWKVAITTAAGCGIGTNTDSRPIRHPLARELLGLSHVLASIAAMLRRGAQRADAAIEQRRRARLALEQLEAMGERELRDIGLTRGDIEAVVEGRLTRDPFAPSGAATSTRSARGRSAVPEILEGD